MRIARFSAVPLAVLLAAFPAPHPATASAHTASIAAPALRTATRAAPAPAPQDPAPRQPLIGIVVESGSGLPIAGAMAILVGPSGERTDRMLTDAAGRFELVARETGPHTITVERIGYRTLTTPPFEPAAHVGDPMTIPVPVEPVALTGIDVAAGQRCEVRPEEGRATAQVWEEVRKALAAEAFTREAGLYRYDLLRFTRELDRDAEEVISDISQLSSDRPGAFVSLPIETLARRGFVQAEGDSATTYYAPDAGAMLSDPFLDTHCLGLTEGEDGQIGLTFEPVAGRFVPDIAGVLWLDAETAELRGVSYQYVNLLRSREIGEPGGEVYFARMPDGAWIVRQWWIRMPMLEAAERGRVRRTGYREEGGITHIIRDAFGRRVLDSRVASLFGVVTDSVGTAPPDPEVVVEMIANRRVAVTVPDGSFVFSDLAQGIHRLRVVSPRARRWGIAVPATEAGARTGEVGYAQLRLPSMDDLLEHSCGGAPRPEGTAAVLARVVAGGGEDAAQARVGVSWPAATGFAPGAIAAPLRPGGGPLATWSIAREGHYTRASTVSDGRGLVLLCDVPQGSRLRFAVRATDGGSAPATRTVFVPVGRRSVVATIPLRLREAAGGRVRLVERVGVRFAEGEGGFAEGERARVRSAGKEEISPR